MDEIVIQDTSVFTEITKNIAIYSYSPIALKINKNIEQNNISLIEDINTNENNDKIIIETMKINGNFSMYLLFFGFYKIVNIDQLILRQNQQFFDEKLDIISFLDSECEEQFYINITESEISNIDEKYSQIKKEILLNKTNVIKEVKKAIVSSLIKRSQIKTRDKRSNKLVKRSKFIKKQYKKNDFVVLKQISKNVQIVYNINDQFLYVLKSFNKDIEESKKLYQREIKIYEALKNINPYICKFYGNFEDELKFCIVLEYIEGDILQKYILKNHNNIDDITKYKIIFEILFSVEHIHFLNIVLRDLKWDNIIIDSYNDAILIDFDRAKLRNSLEFDEEETTNNVGVYYFMSPEQFQRGEFSFQSDIYSIGMIIHFIFSEKNYEEVMSFQLIHDIYDNKQNILTKDKEFSSIPKQFEYLKNHYHNCLNFCPETRPTVTLVYNLFLYFISNKYRNAQIPEINNIIINRGILSGIVKNISDQEIIEFYQNFRKSAYECSSSISFLNGLKYLYDDLNDINSAIHHFKLSADKNNPYSQYYLGVIYYKNLNINKSVHYLTLSANQNYFLAQFFLGVLYLQGKHVKRDVNKGVQYITLAANQNYLSAQVYLGLMYLNGKYVEFNSTKAFHYLTLAADQNDSNDDFLSEFSQIDDDYFLYNKVHAQYVLGYSYLKGVFNSKDINKSLKYLKLAADKDDQLSQILLGNIYESNEYDLKDIEKAVHYYSLAANKNNPKAQALLGSIYINPEYRIYNVEKAVFYLTLAANQDEPDAQIKLAKFYLLTESNKKNVKKAIHYFELAASQNKSEAQLFLHVIHFNNKYNVYDIEKSIHYLKAAADNNNENALIQLSNFYYNGKYVKQDTEKAIKILNNLAGQNYKIAFYFLGIIYYFGQYIPKNINKAIYYLNIASQQDEPASQYLLGIIYLNEKCIDKAIYYLKLSSQNNNYLASSCLGTLYFHGTLVPKDINKSIYYFKIAEKKNHHVALFYLGYFYLEGKYISQDIEKAIHYLKFASELSNSEAQYLLGKTYYEGNIVPLNIEKSIYYLTMAANNNNSEAQYYLGVVYYCNEHIPKDIKKAIHYFKESACFNNSYAKNNLGVIYKNGDGVNTNITQSIEYFEEAIKQKDDLYSIYNLARILYFGLNGIKINIRKSILLLEKAAKQNFLPAIVFLFYISINFKDKEKAKSYYLRIEGNKTLKSLILYIYEYFEEKDIIILRFVEFIKQYDLLHLFIYSFAADLIKFIFKGRFEIYQKCQQKNQTKLQKNLNKDFYDGFYNNKN